MLKDTDQLVFRQAFKSGVTYWDTADSYGWGGNEKAIGSYFARFPGDREKVFLVTKAASSNSQELSEKLNTSLQRMNTSYIDMYLLHYVSDVGKELTPEVKAWAESAKSKGTIRLFGFSAHKNMETSMLAAAQQCGGGLRNRPLSMVMKSVPFSVIEKCTTPKGVWG